MGAALRYHFVATIHQPSAEVFFCFDNLLCLVPGGIEAYVGKLGEKAADLEAFLAAIKSGRLEAVEGL